MTFIFTSRPGCEYECHGSFSQSWGKVLPVGGIKEKVLAAHRAGIKTIIMPKLCEKDLHDVPKNVRSDITFHFVENMKDVLKIALQK